MGWIGIQPGMPERRYPSRPIARGSAVDWGLFQPGTQYGQIFIMNADGTGKRMLTDSLWEDSMPLYIPAKFL
jgi:hypothetical protein